MPKINKKLIVIFLLMQVSLSYALPAWANLNLCIGFDGHVDFEGSGFVGRTIHPFPLPTAVSSDDGHHGDCVDIAIGGFLSENIYIRAQLFRYQIGDIAFQIEGQGTLFCQIALPQLSSKPSFYPENGTNRASFFSCHSTVVLLI